MRAVQALFLCFGALSAALPAFLAVALADRGFAPPAIGVIVGVGAIAATIAIPFWGHVGDVVLGRARTFRIALVVAAGFALAYGLSLPPVFLAGVVVGLTFAQSSFNTLSDALAVNAVRADYGRVRQLASLSFAFTVLLFGALYQDVGFGPAPIVYAGCALAMLLTTFGVPDVPRARLADLGPGALGDKRGDGRAVRRSWGGSFRVALRLQPRLRPVLLACSLVGAGIVANTTFFGLRLFELGGGPADLAVSGALQAAAEVPTMLLSARLVRRFGLRRMFAGGAILYGIVIVGWSLAPTPGVLVAVRGAAGVGFAIVWVSAALSMGVLLPPRLQATGQALVQTLGLGVAAAVASVAGGAIYGLVGGAAVFLCAALSVFAAAAVGIRSFPARGALLRTDAPEPAWSRAEGGDAPA